MCNFLFFHSLIPWFSLNWLRDLQALSFHYFPTLSTLSWFNSFPTFPGQYDIFINVIDSATSP